VRIAYHPENLLVNTLNQTPEHPANEDIAAFALGKETPNAETIAEHIANCTRYEAIIAKTPRDSVLVILNEANPGQSLTGPHAPKTNPPSADELPEELRRQTKYSFLKVNYLFSTGYEKVDHHENPPASHDAGRRGPLDRTGKSGGRHWP
jgi:hypothetical protein